MEQKFQVTFASGNECSRESLPGAKVRGNESSCYCPFAPHWNIQVWMYKECKSLIMSLIDTALIFKKC